MLITLIATIVFWILLFVVSYLVDKRATQTEEAKAGADNPADADDSGSSETDNPQQLRHNSRFWTQIFLWIVLLNSFTFSVVRLFYVTDLYDLSGRPEITTWRDAGTYQTDEVHYVIAGMKTDTQDLIDILPDDLNGTIKIVQSHQMQYNPDAIAEALDDDIRAYAYQTATVWMTGVEALLKTDDILNSSLRDHVQIIAIDPCPNTLVLRSELAQNVVNRTPWRRTLVYCEGWLSLIPYNNGQSLNLQTLQQARLRETVTGYVSKPKTDHVIGVVISENNQYLQPEALKGLYSDAIQVTVPAQHCDLLNAKDQYRQALQEIWDQHQAKLAEEAAYEEYDELFDDPLHYNPDRTP